MDLKVSITDENNDILQTVQIYQDGSDGEGAKKIRDWIENTFDTEDCEEKDEEVQGELPD